MLTRRVTAPGSFLIVLAHGVGIARITAQSNTTLRAEIRTTSYGVPHVRAGDLAGAGFGLGYAFARADLCTVADRWVTVRGERSKYFGPEGRRDFQAWYRSNALQAVTNLQSDFYWKRILALDVVGHELDQPAPLGPTPEVRELVRGYAAGYNRYLRDVGVGNIPDRRCRGMAWVRPITEQDLYLRALHWNILMSGRWIGPMTDAVPPTGGEPAGADSRGWSRSLGSDEGYPVLPLTMSNVVALGKEATDNGKGMVFANPHWRWHGPERWFEAHLTVPGVMDVYGGTLEGLPVVMFGFTGGAAWSHTASVPRRETVYELRLAPGSPTSYIYEGMPHRMMPLTVSVDVQEADGRLTKRSHTYWETRFGPVIADANFVWSGTTAYAVKTVTMSVRWLNQQVGMMQARTAAELDRVGKTYMALGWLNTAAADSSGQVVYGDRSAVPHVTNALLERCVTSAVGKRLLAERLPVLDGWRSDCEWGTDPDAPLPGIFGPGSLPQLARTDYVANSNDSHWVNNPRQLLEGFPSIIGDERTPRSLRTRNGLLKIERRLAGTDGLPGNRFTLQQLEAITMDNRVLSGELWRDSLVALCRRMPVQKGIPEACDVLAKWDLTENLDSPGAFLWRRFVQNLCGDVFFDRLGMVLDREFFAIPFDPSEPAATPGGLNTGNPRVTNAFTAAVSDLRDSGIPLSGTLREYQYDERAGVRIPIHGGPGSTGQYNLVVSQSGWVPGKGWSTIVHASSYVLWVQYTDRGPAGRSVLASSQSDNPDSPNHADQTKLFSEKKSKPIRFREEDIRSDPNLTLTRICGTSAGSTCR